MLTRLETIIVDKPWGRIDIPEDFGDFGGRRVGEIWFAHPDGNDEPIMVKFLFTSERLSIQVHPDDTTAQAAGYPRGKEECWLVLETIGHAELGVGLTTERDAAALRQAALDGTIEAMINWRPAAPGDFVYNPAGTIHAIGPGMVVVEIQQNVDCTYRLYDYGRPRELHLDEALNVAKRCIHSDPHDTHVAENECRVLVEGPYFHVLHLSGPQASAFLPKETRHYTFVPLTGTCTVGGETVALGECVMVDEARLISIPSGIRALLCWPS